MPSGLSTSSARAGRHTSRIPRRILRSAQRAQTKAAVNVCVVACNVSEPLSDQELVCGATRSPRRCLDEQGAGARGGRHPLRRRGLRLANDFMAQGSSNSKRCRSPGKSFQARQNRISHVSWVSRRVITHWPGWTMPGAIASSTSAGTAHGTGIHDTIASRSLRFFAADIAPVQIIRKCTACNSAMSWMASGETPRQLIVQLLQEALALGEVRLSAEITLKLVEMICGPDGRTWREEGIPGTQDVSKPTSVYRVKHASVCCRARLWKQPSSRHQG